ncbi:PilZ domain-containing protein [Hyalangium versicolor]|uniref:PilZ domain-containing protein n=1 Tax=Hyalangium versicolor TaxID=2861190 RepID=UPI001CC9FC0C|nr:PilZ domain-containing protein [Hyalangium versicolor]
MSQHERRRHQRYPLRLAIKVQCRGQEMTADIINASVSGCLLQMAIPLEQGEALDVSIPQLNMPKARLLVVRSESTSSGYMVATCFDNTMADEPSISRLSTGTNGTPEGGTQH